MIVHYDLYHGIVITLGILNDTDKVPCSFYVNLDFPEKNRHNYDNTDTVADLFKDIFTEKGRKKIKKAFCDIPNLMIFDTEGIVQWRFVVDRRWNFTKTEIIDDVCKRIDKLIKMNCKRKIRSVEYLKG